MVSSELRMKLEGVMARLLNPVAIGKPGESRYTPVGFPYLPSAVCRVQFIWSDEVQTAAMDQFWRVYLSPKFVEGLSKTEFTGLIGHEIFHGVLEHHERRGSRDPKLWNVACDLEINCCPKLRRMLPPDALQPEKFGWSADLSAEQYYDLLQKEEPPEDGDGEDGDEDGDENGEGGGGDDAREGEGEESSGASPGNGDCGSIVDGVPRPWEEAPPDEGGSPGVSGAEARLMKRQVAEAIATSSQARGDLPGNWVSRLTSPLKPPKVKWQNAFKSALKKAEVWVKGRAEKSYRSPSMLQATAQEGVVLAGMVSPIPSVCFVVDTSGSMNDADVSAALSEIDEAVRVLKRAKVRAIPCDTRAGEAQVFRRAQDIKITGRGGTDMTVGIEAALALKPRPNIIVTLTDGYTPWPLKPSKGCKQIAVILGHCNNGGRGVPVWMKKIVVDD